MNVEPTSTTPNEGRAGRAGRVTPSKDDGAYNQVAPGPSDSDDLSDDGLSDGQALAEYQFPSRKGWRSETSLNCSICTFYGRTYDDIHNRSEFETHIREVHAGKSGIGKREERVACVTHCTWVCSVCGAESYYPTVRVLGKDGGIQHGGPEQRSFDKRFAFAYCRDSRYPSHKRAVGKIAGARGPVLLYHEGMAFSPEQAQTDPSLRPFIKEKKSAPSVERTSRPTRSKAGGQKPVQTTRAGRANR